ncbi:MAG: hypothetical protein LBH37_03090 [Oscillospiraceae bacterium]|nr:hypothetical protein [Oscillospiraceae bacterium]
MGFEQYWTSSCLADSFVPLLPYAISYSSDREFASGFLQIPPHDGYPCLLLTVPTAKPVYGGTFATKLSSMPGTLKIHFLISEGGFFTDQIC